jgi:hypothetical protein
MIEIAFSGLAGHACKQAPQPVHIFFFIAGALFLPVRDIAFSGQISAQALHSMFLVLIHK